MQNDTFPRSFGRMRLACVALALGGLTAGCGGEESGGRTTNGTTNGNHPGGTGGSSQGNGGGIDPGNIDPGRTGGTNDPRDLPVREEVCDDQGNCTCLRLALVGTLTSAADDTDTQPFVDWLNNNSDGTATVTMVTAKPTLDETWLSQYDVLLVANVNGWQFSDAELAAVETWVRETGGGIVALTGFISEDATEPADTSQLIRFAGLQFVPPWTASNDAQVAQNTPVYYKGGSEDLKNCMVWNPNPGDPQITAAIPFTPQAGDLDAITFELDYVGAFYGYTVNGPEGSTVVANDPVTGGAMARAYEVDGTGRIFAFGDEWVIFRNQWQVAQGASPSNQQQDEWNPCWVPPQGGAPGFFHSVETLYQTRQFWYNVINWVAPPNECNFVIEDPGVIVR